MCRFLILPLIMMVDDGGRVNEMANSQQSTRSSAAVGRVLRAACVLCAARFYFNLDACAPYAYVNIPSQQARVRRGGHRNLDVFQYIPPPLISL